jgi:cellulose synthase (UDP-forming)
MEKTLIKAKRLSNTTILFLLLAPACVFSYVVYVFNITNADNIFLYILLIIADGIGILAVMGLWFTILFDVLIPDHHRVHETGGDMSFLKDVPTVDILITVAGESLDVIKKTAIHAKNIEYPHKTFILDDLRSTQVKELAEQIGVEYLTRDKNIHAKAGNVNNGLKNVSNAEFFVILDADQVPKKNFISVLLPYMSDKKVAMVQSPQHFVNKGNFIAQGTSEAQDIFYKYVCPAKNASNSAFCVGTNMLFRRKAIDEAGGIAQVSHSEDIWTSYRLHELGWKTLFVNEILAEGYAPDTISSYFKQQQRWAKGGLSMLFEKNPFASSKLTLDQKLQYFLSNSFYLVTITIVAYLLFPIIYLLFDIKPLHTDASLLWILHYAPYVLMYYSLSWLLLGRIKISMISVSIASFYPYLLAFFSILRGGKEAWVATSSVNRKKEPLMKWIWPHVLLIILTLFSLFIGWYNPIEFWTTLFYSLLACWNLYLLVLFVTSGRNSTNAIA